MDGCQHCPWQAAGEWLFGVIAFEAFDKSGLDLYQVMSPKQQDEFGLLLSSATMGKPFYTAKLEDAWIALRLTQDRSQELALAQFLRGFLSRSIHKETKTEGNSAEDN